ncbi:hypothetical protein NB694_000510 [Pantoea ananatis]|uniref:hypothetical protein n=1 Tax=Pantoea ananas TaxID=553 RepID=UPI0021F6C3F0|nr:hypothetical protein [Pantoea ananatis]MCW0310710.1 hypothetical protein [Pantoea ananatis]
MKREIQYIEDFTLEVNCGSLEEMAEEMCAMKMAAGLFFRSLPPEHQIAHLNSLENFDNKAMRDLAKFLRQFVGMQSKH